jgi:hypothetical protein
LLQANPRDAVVAYRACPVGGGACAPVMRESDGAARPDRTDAGTTFEADFEQGTDHRTIVTPAWNGRVTSVSPPGVAGALTVGSTVRATDGA